MNNIYINTNPHINQKHPQYMTQGTCYTNTASFPPLTPSTPLGNTPTNLSPQFTNDSYPLDSRNFSPEQKQAIIHHLMITKSSIPVKLYPHVPCKFYQQGACQAGANCPFSHNLNTCRERPVCKYFQRGHCKFGAKCCNVHPTNNGSGASDSLPLSPISPTFHNHPTTTDIDYTYSNATNNSNFFYNDPSSITGEGNNNNANKFPTTDMQDPFPFDMDEGLEYIPGELSELLTPLQIAHRRRSSERGPHAY